MKLDYTKTSRGFSLIQFEDLYDNKCNIQKSSLATEDAIWFGIENAQPRIMSSKTPQGGVGWIDYPIPDDVLLTTRMHLSKDDVRELITILQNFVDTGEID